MTQDQIQIGQLLKVIAPRWDRPPGSLGRVTETGYHFLGAWWFTVEWLTTIGNRYPGSLRMGEEELPTFELATESAVSIISRS